MQEGKKRLVVSALCAFLVLSIALPCVLSQEDSANTSVPVVKKTFKGSVTIKSGTPNDYNFRIVSGLPVIEIAPGKTGRFRLYARKNPEGEPLHNIKISITNTEFQATIENPVIQELRNEGMAVLYVDVTLPSDIMEGDYKLMFKVEADEFPESVYQPVPDIIIRAKKPNIVPRIFLITGIIAVLSILIWRKLHVK